MCSNYCSCVVSFRVPSMASINFLVSSIRCCSVSISFSSCRILFFFPEISISDFRISSYNNFFNSLGATFAFSKASLSFNTLSVSAPAITPAASVVNPTSGPAIMPPATNAPAYLGVVFKKESSIACVTTLPSFLESCIAPSFPERIHLRTVSGFVFKSSAISLTLYVFI